MHMRPIGLSSSTKKRSALVSLYVFLHGYYYAPLTLRIGLVVQTEHAAIVHRPNAVCPAQDWIYSRCEGALQDPRHGGCVFRSPIVSHPASSQVQA